jgi:MarR family transcriptional regulator for hemolysin
MRLIVFKIDEHTGILIKKAARLFEQVANRNLDKLGVTYSQTIFLVRLWEKDGQTQIELAKSAGLKQPSVVRMLDRMERDGLITRARSKTDRRIFNFYLTDKAKKACRQLEDHANEMHDLATVNIPKKDMEKLNDLLADIINNLQKFVEKN